MGKKLKVMLGSELLPRLYRNTEWGRDDIFVSAPEITCTHWLKRKMRKKGTDNRLCLDIKTWMRVTKMRIEWEALTSGNI